MRRRSMLSALVAIGALAAPPAASAEVRAAAYRCEADAEWSVYEVGNSDYGDLTYDTGTITGTGCRRLGVTRQDDGSINLAVEEDFGYGGTWTFDFFGAELSNSTAFAGTAQRQGGPGTGVVTIAGDRLNAVIAGVAANGDETVATHTGTGSCGTGCYRTRMVWAGTTPVTGIE